MKDSSSTGKGELHSLAGLVVLWGYHSRDCGRLTVRSGDFKRFCLGVGYKQCSLSCVVK